VISKSKKKHLSASKRIDSLCNVYAKAKTVSKNLIIT